MKKHKLVWPVCATGIIVFFLSLLGTAQAQGLKGVCSGTVKQDKPAISYGVTLQLDGSTGTVDYGSAGCSGTLTFIRKDGNTYWYRESISYGRDKCIDGGTMQLTLLGDAIIWYWSGNGSAASGTLSGNVKPVQENFEITVLRQSSNNQCTMGYMSVNGEIMAYTLELPWKNNQQNVSSIPAGTYSGMLRYDKADKWRIQLQGVPGRTAVQIHIGNYTRDIKGCVLIGSAADVTNCTVTGSKTAYTKLKEKFYGTSNPVSCPNVNIVITFQ